MAWAMSIQGGPGVLREERKAFFRYRPGLLGNRIEGSKRENNAQENRATLGRAWFLSPMPWFTHPHS